MPPGKNVPGWGRGGTSSQKEEVGSFGGGEDEEGEDGSVDRKGQGEEFDSEGSIPPRLSP